eukprot:COSAG01_NODE_48810_length_377_cov_8.294964_1_plen_27_part_01
MTRTVGRWAAISPLLYTSRPLQTGHIT